MKPTRRPSNLTRLVYAAVLAAGLAACGSKVATLETEPAKEVTIYALNKTVEVKVTPKNKNGEPIADIPVEWTSSSPAVVKAEAGKLTAVSSGRAILTAAAGGKTVKLVIDVIPISKLVVEPSYAVLVGPKGATQKVVARALDDKDKATMVELVFRMADPKIATVDRSGVITASASGKTKLVVSVGEKKTVVPVTVQIKQVGGVTLRPTRMLLRRGEGKQMDAEIQDSNGNPLENMVIAWSSDSPEVATVSTDGKVSAVGPGTAIISAQVEAATSTASVTVTP